MDFPTAVLGYLVLAAVATCVCVLIVRELAFATVPELRRQNRRRLL